MILYHGSNTGNIKVLKPNQADHDRPYVYMTTMDVVAAFYLCNAVERPSLSRIVPECAERSIGRCQWIYL